MYSDEYNNEIAHYRTALICRNGHTATEDIEGYPEKSQRFCKECGAENISKCPECGEPIHGYHHTPVMLTCAPMFLRSTAMLAVTLTPGRKPNSTASGNLWRKPSGSQGTRRTGWREA